MNGQDVGRPARRPKWALQTPGRPAGGLPQLRQRLRNASLRAATPVEGRIQGRRQTQFGCVSRLAAPFGCQHGNYLPRRQRRPGSASSPADNPMPTGDEAWVGYSAAPFRLPLPRSDDRETLSRTDRWASPPVRTIAGTAPAVSRTQPERLDRGGTGLSGSGSPFCSAGTPRTDATTCRTGRTSSCSSGSWVDRSCRGHPCREHTPTRRERPYIH